MRKAAKQKTQEPRTEDQIARGARIRTMRKALGLSQEDLAEKLRVDQSTVSDIEYGAGFSADVLMKLAESLKVSAAIIMQGHDEQVWPFRHVDITTFMAVTPEKRPFVEGKLAAAIEDATGKREDNHSILAKASKHDLEKRASPKRSKAR